MLTGHFLPLAFCFTWQAVPGRVSFCNLLSVGQFQFMTLQPINFTSIKRGWHEFAFRSSGNRGPVTSPKPRHSAYGNADAEYKQTTIKSRVQPKK